MMPSGLPPQGMTPDPMAMYANYPLKEISYPHPHDVLCGRGGATNNHIGNSHWRQLVSANKELYLKLPKRQKQLLSKSIVHAVRCQHPPGRFLAKHPQTDLWYDVGDQRALEKTSQALREGAPKLKEKLKQSPKEEAEATEEAASHQSREKKSTAASASKQSVASSPSPISVSATTTSTGSSSSSKRRVVVSTKSTADSVSSGSVEEVRPQRQNNPQSSNITAPPPVPYENPQTPAVANYGEYPQHLPGSTPVSSTNELYGPPLPSLPPTIPPHGPVPDRRSNKPNLPLSDFSNESPYQQHMHQNEYNADYEIYRHPPQHQNNPRDDAIAGGPTWADDEPIPAPPDGGFSGPQRFSFGTVMSVDTQNLAAEPPTPIQPGEFSMGSLLLTDQELKLLVSTSADDVPRKQQYNSAQQQQQQQQQRHGSSSARGSNGTADERPPTNVTFANEEKMPAPVDLGLEPAGLSTGSMMSIGTIASAIPRLENAGLSFGSTMSFIPAAVDGGLDDIGTSFGSMVIGENNGDQSANVPAPTPAGPMSAPPPVWGTPALPTTLDQQRSQGDLLDCSDTDSDDEQASQKLIAQKSSDWERLKATFEQQMRSGSFSGPPILAQGPSYSSAASNQNQNAAALHIPTTNFTRDISQISAMSATDNGYMNNDLYQQYPFRQQQNPQYVVPGERLGQTHQSSFEDMPPPPPGPSFQNNQEGDDWQQYEKTMLNRGSSLAGEEFNYPPGNKKSEGGLLD